MCVCVYGKHTYTRTIYVSKVKRYLSNLLLLAKKIVVLFY